MRERRVELLAVGLINKPERDITIAALVAVKEVGEQPENRRLVYFEGAVQEELVRVIRAHAVDTSISAVRGGAEKLGDYRVFLPGGVVVVFNNSGDHLGKAGAVSWPILRRDPENFGVELSENGEILKLITGQQPE